MLSDRDLLDEIRRFILPGSLSVNELAEDIVVVLTGNGKRGIKCSRRTGVVYGVEDVR